VNDQPATRRNLRVRLNMDLAPGNMELLSPGAAMRWENCQFELNPASGGDADFCVVLWNAQPRDRFRCARENTLLIIGEPPGKMYAKGFYNQFAHVLDTRELSGHAGLIVSAPGLNWHVGLDMSSGSYRYGYDHLAALQRPVKENRIAVVCSNAASTPGHRRRLALLAHLKKRLGDRIVHFGRGFQPIDDKMEAILPYRYQLVLENCQAPNYWTEKLADAYLGWAFPVYLGCTNIENYFAPDAFQKLDGDDFEGAERVIGALLEGGDEDRQVAAITQARRLMLERYNPFAWCAHWVNRLHRDAPAQDIELRIHKAFRPFPRGQMYRLRQLLSGSD
jgi:hypothetical protein